MQPRSGANPFAPARIPSRGILMIAINLKFEKFKKQPQVYEYEFLKE